MLGLLSPRSPPFHTNRGEPTGHRRLTLHSGEAVTAAASDCPPSFSYIKGICIGGGDHKDERLAGEKEQDMRRWWWRYATSPETKEGDVGETSVQSVVVD